MMDLFDLPPHNNRPTSIEGAINAQVRAKTQSARVMAEITKQGLYGCTMSELKAFTGIAESSTLSARVNRLMIEGKIYASDDRRKSEYGINQIVWKAK